MLSEGNGTGMYMPVRFSVENFEVLRSASGE